MTLIKTSLLNAIAVVIKMLTMLGINKILAVYVGPSGYAALGQFQNAVQMITTFASGAVNTGVTKYTAEYFEDQDKQISLWKTAGTISIVGTLVSSILIISFSKFLAEWFLKDKNFYSVFIYFSLTLVFFVFNSLFMAIINGKKEIFHYVVANISGSIFSLVITGILVNKFGIYGALVSLAVYQSFSFFVTFFIICKRKWFRISYILGKVDKGIAINLSKFTAMALVSAVCVPLSHIFIRDYLGKSLGADAAGFWEAMWRLSGAYLLLVTTTLSVYYLPKLSELSSTSRIRNEILYGFKLIVPLAAISGFVIYLLREFIILFLFTKNFLPMSELFAWQMFGDALKICSWIISYLMLSKAMVRIYICTEIIFSIFFYILVYLFVEYFGLKGAAMAHAVNYGVYLLVMYKLVFAELRKDAAQ